MTLSREELDRCLLTEVLGLRAITAGVNADSARDALR